MPRDLFGDVTRPSISVGNRKWYTLPLSLFSHSAIAGILIALPILAPAVMPSVFADDDPVWMGATLPTPPPVPKPTSVVTAEPRVPTAAFTTVAPTGINPEKPLPDAGWEDSNAPVGVIDGNFDTTTSSPPPPPVQAAPPAPVRVADLIRPPQKLRDVKPIYPAIAQEARVEGIVIIEATIGEDGQVTNARILRSLPLLDQSAIEAVRQWQFTPTLLNGVPVRVIMTVTIHFTLR